MVMGYGVLPFQIEEVVVLDHMQTVLTVFTEALLVEAELWLFGMI
jgi:hypothetical protein